MNRKILNKEVQDFIQANLKTDITKLILKGSPFKEVTIQEIAEQIISKNKCKEKLPTWFKTSHIYYPNKINIEQTSSETAAEYKTNLVSGNTLADLTGGFGVDTYYFSKKIANTIHLEINPNLSEIVLHNFNQLGVANCKIISSDGILFLKNSKLNSDWIYLDPSRRNVQKGKVFLLKDCLPCIPENLDLLFEKTKNILIKTSPILDITNAINELCHVKEVHVIAINNEVKEVLYLLEKNYDNNIKLVTLNFENKNTQCFSFHLNKEVNASFSLPKTYLYEPNAAILKSGGFNQVTEYFKLAKLHPNTHLYTSDTLIEFPGRRFKINKIINYSLKAFKKLPFKQANITTRNFPDSVEKIRKKTKLLDGGNSYLFFTTNIFNKLIVLQCEKI